MRILCVNSYINEFGGAELSALNLASGLADRNHEVHFLAESTASSPAAERLFNTSIKFHYRSFFRPYPINKKGGPFLKAIWHLLDLADPRHTRTFDEVCHQIAPDLIVLHAIDGIGLNVWRAIRQRDTPCIQVLHDLSIICLNKSRYRNGRQCRGLCLPCRAQKLIRMRWIDRAKNFSFVSPSRAVLSEVDRYADLSQWPRQVIPNANRFLVKNRTWSASSRARLLYLGRLDALKGVDQLLRCAHEARKRVTFDLDVLGNGALEQTLRDQYASCRWIKFHGRVDQETIAEYMAEATALLVPSLWLENFPGVAVHALFAGLPIIASDIGGLPEIVIDGETGKLVPPRDEGAWTNEIIHIVKDKQRVVAWSAACLDAASAFAVMRSLDAYELLMHELLRRTDGERLAY
jgi:glycosyltransferase involved in cell wall biosynthesis